MSSDSGMRPGEGAHSRSSGADDSSVAVQPSLTLDPPRTVGPDPDPLGRPTVQPSLDGHTLDERFADWLAANGHMIELLVRLAREWRAAGHGRCSITLLVERARWEHGIRSVDDRFAINNSYRSRIAREILRRAPDLGDDFFQFRVLTSRGLR